MTIQINQLPAGAAVSGTDLVASDQGATTVKLTATQLDTFIAALKVANNLSDVASASTSRDNLGLGANDAVNFDSLVVNGVGGIDPNAALEIDGTDKGFLFSQLTTTQRDALTTPTDGLVVYNSTTKQYEGAIGGLWYNLGGETKTVYLTLFGSSYASDGRYSMVSIPNNGNNQFTFGIPQDFTTLVSIELIGYPIDAGGAGTGKKIDLDSYYHQPGTSITTHNETFSYAAFDTGSVEVTFLMDVSQVFTSLEAGDLCGLGITHNAIGGAIKYIQIKLVYT